MQIFDKEDYRFGELKTKETLKFYFEYLGDGEIISSKTSCGFCSSSYIEGNKIHIHYYPTKIAKHLLYQGFQMVKKSVAIKIEEEGKTKMFKLTWSGKLIKS